MTLINCRQTIALFFEKVDLINHDFSKEEYYQFPELISVRDDIATVDIQKYFDHLNKLKKDSKSRFDDVLTMNICD